MEARLGFISPMGTFYPCGYGCHTELAYQICREHGYKTRDELFHEADAKNEDLADDVYQSSTNDRKTLLLQKGYLSISVTFFTESFCVCGHPTMSQQEVLDKLLMEWHSLNDKQIVKAIHANPEKLKSDSYITMHITNFDNFRESILVDHSEHRVQPHKLITPPQYLMRGRRPERDGD